MDKEILKKIENKFESLEQDTDTHLSGLLHSKLITYWDYIKTDTLLTLQSPRTNFPDEMVFVMYHQINELLFKLILWELEQVADDEKLNVDTFSMRLDRISRYFNVLSSSFEIMGDGMDKEQYFQFRDTLTPASGFQSAQYRMIEFASTDMINLVDRRFKASAAADASSEELFEILYWQAAGKDHKTGQKSQLIKLFEKKYKASFMNFLAHYRSRNLSARFQTLPESERENLKLKNAMRNYDHTVNIRWVMAHYHAAAKYLGPPNTDAEGTGGSDWRKYMHPKSQRRIFFPELWTEEELKNWGIDNLDGHKTLI